METMNATNSTAEIVKAEAFLLLNYIDSEEIGTPAQRMVIESALEAITRIAGGTLYD